MANAEAAREEHYASIFSKLDGKVYREADENAAGMEPFVDILVKDPIYEDFIDNGYEYDPKVDYPLESANG